MNETMNTANDTFAVIADTHGNRWALEAVLHDIDLRGIQQIINLGDHLTGPLDPVGTAEILLERDMIHVCGNDDRDLFLSYEQLSSAQKYTHDRLTSVHLEWIHTLPTTTIVAKVLFVCHGDLFNAPYLLEHIEPSGVLLRSTRDIEDSVKGIAQPVILCGHSHIPRTVALSSGKLIVNPGSVGLPAYTMDTPIFYALEAGSPHARYALINKVENTWQVEHIQVPYDWECAASAARGNQRDDWAEWLMTGRAR